MLHDILEAEILGSVVYKAPKERIESICAQYALRSARTGRCGPGWPGVVWVHPKCKGLGNKERKAMKERGHQVAQSLYGVT